MSQTMNAETTAGQETDEPITNLVAMRVWGR